MKQILAASAAAFFVLSIMWGAARLTSHYRTPKDRPLVVEAVQHSDPSK